MRLFWTTPRKGDDSFPGGRRRDGGDAVKLIGDDPIIRCMERSGYPPWQNRDGNESDRRETDASRGEDDDRRE